MSNQVRVNDLAIKIANVNGTGSASANGMLTQVVFRMGIPVSGKNVFPSNIQGLPTWYEIRANKDGFTARTEKFDFAIAMNAETYAQDIDMLQSGGYLLYDSTWSGDDNNKSKWQVFHTNINSLCLPMPLGHPRRPPTTGS